ncbi:hypothetical protein GOP47_0012940, partial [Adiantum capillus-veneris]
ERGREERESRCTQRSSTTKRGERERERERERMCPSNKALSGLWQQQGAEDPWGLVQAFRMLDRDGDGAINGQDLSAFFGGCVGKSLSQEEAASMIAMADLDGDGAVGLDEFQRLMAGGGGAVSLQQQRQKVELAALRRVFDVLDVNKDGELGLADLQAAMAMSGLPLSDYDLDAMLLAAASSPSSTAIDFDAFSKLPSLFF